MNGLSSLSLSAAIWRLGVCWGLRLLQARGKAWSSRGRCCRDIREDRNRCERRRLDEEKRAEAI